MNKVWCRDLIVIVGALLLVAGGQGAVTKRSDTICEYANPSTASRIHRNDSTKPHVCSRGNTFAYSSTNPNRQTHRQTDCNPCAAANRLAG